MPKEVKHHLDFDFAIAGHSRHVTGGATPFACGAGRHRKSVANSGINEFPGLAFNVNYGTPFADNSFPRMKGEWH
jgi:hypothetical protein